MVENELRELIKSLNEIKGDTSHVEAKACEGGFPKRLWESVSAFANTPGGGIIILGVEETPEGLQLVGLKDPRKFQSDMASLCSQMVPQIRALIEIHRIDGHFLLTAEIPESSYKEKPCYYQGSGAISGSFIRVADGDRQLTQYEVQGFLDGRGQPAYDMDAVPDSSLADLDPELTDSFIDAIKTRKTNMQGQDKNKILRTYRILTGDLDKETVSLAGLLCLGKYPQEYFPGLSLHVLIYPGKTEGQTGERGERLEDNIKLEGPLVRAVPEALRAVKRNLQRRTVVQGFLGEGILEYPEVFLREAVVNAIGHRDYSPLARGTAIQIKMFTDRIEISNPGGLFGPVTEDRLGENGLQATRNAFLMKILEDLPVPGENRVLCENRGTGIPSMISALAKAGMEPPVFQDHRNLFRVICHNRTLFDKETLEWLTQYSGLVLSERQRYALAFLRHRERITNPEYSRMNECDSRIATKDLSDLTRANIINQHGVGRWTSYTLSAEKRVVPPSRRKIKDDRLKQILAIIRTRKEMGREELEQALGMKRTTVQYWLQILLKAGKIRHTPGALRNPRVKYQIKGK